MHKKIVYIEDDSEMIDLIKLVLERKGYEVSGALGGRSGIDLIHEIMPDLVLLDLMMPDIDGWEVYTQLRGSDDTKNIPVIIITAKAEAVDRVLGIEIARVDDYLTKPFKPQELLDCVEKYLPN